MAGVWVHRTYSTPMSFNSILNDDCPILEKTYSEKPFFDCKQLSANISTVEQLEGNDFVEVVKVEAPTGDAMKKWFCAVVNGTTAAKF